MLSVIGRGSKIIDRDEFMILATGDPILAKNMIKNILSITGELSTDRDMLKEMQNWIAENCNHYVYIRRIDLDTIDAIVVSYNFASADEKILFEGKFFSAT